MSQRNRNESLDVSDAHKNRDRDGSIPKRIASRPNAAVLVCKTDDGEECRVYIDFQNKASLAKLDAKINKAWFRRIVLQLVFLKTRKALVKLADENITWHSPTSMDIEIDHKLNLNKK